MRLAMSVPLIVIGIDHLATGDRYLPIMPEVIPFPGTVIALTGLCEIAGGVGLHVPTLRRITGIMLAIFFVAIFPANIKMAVDATHAGVGVAFPMGLYLRLLLQPILVWWALVSVGILAVRASG